METFDINIDEIHIEIYTNIVSTDKAETNKVIFDRSMLYIPPVEGYIQPNITLNKYPYFTDEYLYPGDVLSKMIYYQDIVNFFFNKRLFNKIITENFSNEKNEKTEDENTIAHRNIKIMIEYLFPTRPAVRNFTTTFKTRIQNKIQLKPLKVLPWETYLYSYLKLNDGKTYTISKVDWVNDFISHPHYNGIIQLYRKFRKWVNKQIENTTNEKNIKTPNIIAKTNEEINTKIEEKTKQKDEKIKEKDEKIKEWNETIQKPKEPSLDNFVEDFKQVIEIFNNNFMKDNDIKDRLDTFNYDNNTKIFTNIMGNSAAARYANFVNEIKNGDKDNVLEIIPQITFDTNNQYIYNMGGGPYKNSPKWNTYTVDDKTIYEILTKYNLTFEDPIELVKNKISLIVIINIFKTAITKNETDLKKYKSQKTEYEKKEKKVKAEIEKLENEKKEIITKYETEINKINAPATEIDILETRLKCLKDIFKLNAADLKSTYPTIFTYSSNSEIFTEYQKFKRELDENVERGGGIKYRSSNPNIQLLFDDKLNSENTVKLYNTLDKIIKKYFETKSLKNETKDDEDDFKAIKDYLYVGILSKSNKNTILLNMKLSKTIYKDTDSYVPSCKTTNEKLGDTLEQIIYGNTGNIMSDIKPLNSSNLFQQNDNIQKNNIQHTPNDVNIRNQVSEIIDRMTKDPQYKKIQEWVGLNEININNIDLYKLISQNKDITTLINDYFIKFDSKTTDINKYLLYLSKITTSIQQKIKENEIILNDTTKIIENLEKQKLLQENYKNKILILILEIIEKIIKSRQQTGGKKNYSKKISRNKINLRKTKRSRWGK